MMNAVGSVQLSRISRMITVMRVELEVLHDILVGVLHLLADILLVDLPLVNEVHRLAGFRTRRLFHYVSEVLFRS